MENIEDEIAKKFKSREIKDPPKDPELERIKRKKSIVDIMRERNCSEETAERILIEEDAKGAIEGE